MDIDIDVDIQVWCVCVCVRARAIQTHALHRRGPVWFGLQTFFRALAFNANIGAWNTAAVSNMGLVCAAFAVACNTTPTRHCLCGSV